MADEIKRVDVERKRGELQEQLGIVTSAIVGAQLRIQDFTPMQERLTDEIALLDEWLRRDGADGL